MPWQTPLLESAGRQHAADEDEALPPAEAATQECPPCPCRLVMVEFADVPAVPMPFGGVRDQFVNLSDHALVGVDPLISSANQLGREPPVVVKVVPPEARTVYLRLVRERDDANFPGTSASLSAREQGLGHLEWRVRTAVVNTDDQGLGLLEPGQQLPAMAGYRYRVKGSLGGGHAWVTSSNAVRVRRRVAFRPVIRFASGRATLMSVLNTIENDLKLLDFYCHRTADATGAEFGVRDLSEVSPDLIAIGRQAQDAPAEVSVFKPHLVSLICGEFIPSPNGDTPMQSFSLRMVRPAAGGYPPTVDLPLARTGENPYILIPMTTGSHFGGASVDVDGEAAPRPLGPADITNLGSFARILTIRLPAIPASAASITVTVQVKALNQWFVGWAYNTEPVIHLNLRNPDTGGVLTPTDLQALVIHEVGHKLHLTSRGEGQAPDKQPHFYDSFSTARATHQGPHCKQGVGAAEEALGLDSRAAHDAATCTMWGSVKGIVNFCPECKTTLRKVDMSSGL